MTINDLEALQIELTNGCNSYCLHCYTNSSILDNYKLSLDKLKSIITDASSLGVKTVSVSGGEPLLHPNLIEILGLLKEQKFKVSLNTNGLILDYELAKTLKQLEIDFVNISLHGFSSDVHDWLTQLPGSYYKALNALTLLGKLDIPHGINSTIHQKNYRELHKIAIIAFKTKSSSISFFRILNIGRAEKNRMKLSITVKEHQELFINLKKLIQATNCPISFSCEAPYLFWDGSETYSTCNAGVNGCIIKADGDVIPCTGLRENEFICGNIFQNTLEKIWYNSPILLKLRDIQKDPSKLNGECKHCEKLNLCHGGCRAFSYSSKGDIYASDPSCWLKFK